MDKEKSVKVVTLEGTFPELVVKHVYQQGRGTGSNIRAAAAAAIRDLMSKPGLKARRITSAKLTMSIGTRIVDSVESTEGTNVADGLQKSNG
jgi:hypothetical protein